MKKELFPLHGIVTTVNMPFDADKNIVWEDLRRTAKAALDAGVAGFLAPCLASELDWLTTDERYQMAEELVKVTRDYGRGIVLPNIRGKDTSECVAQAGEFLKLGVSGINLCIPTTTETAYEETVAALDALQPPFLCLQDTKQNEMSAAFIQHLFDTYESIRCIKIETLYPGRDYTAVLKATEGRLNVSGSWGSDQMIEAFDRGIHALMPSGLFELFVNVYRLYHERGRDAARKLFFDILPIIVFTRQSDAVNLYLHKRYFQRVGLYSSVNFRAPYETDAVQRAYAEEMIDRALWIRDHMDTYWQ